MNETKNLLKGALSEGMSFLLQSLHDSRPLLIREVDVVGQGDEDVRMGLVCPLLVGSLVGHGELRIGIALLKERSIECSRSLI